MGKVSAGDIGQIVETAGKIGVQAIDASKRRATDFALNQQQIQAQLGLAEKTAQQQYDIARLNVLAQAATGKGGKETKNTGLMIGLGVLGLAIIGGVVYFAVKK